MLAVAAENLAASERVICDIKHSMSAVYSDAFATVEHKIDQLTVSIERMVGSPDVDQGSSM